MSEKKKKTPVQETFYFEAEEQDPENAIMNNEDQLEQIDQTEAVDVSPGVALKPINEHRHNEK